MLRKIIFAVCLVCWVNLSQANMVFQDTQDHFIDAKNLKGKWIILNYWAEWCGPCKAEIPELNQFYKNNSNKDVLLYGVYYDNMPLVDLKRLAQNANIEFPVLSADPAAVWKLEEVSTVPTTFIVNPKGQVAKTLYGASSETRLATALLELQQNYK